MEELSSIIDKKMRERLLRELTEMDDEEFAQWMRRLLKKMRFEVIESSNDAGVVSAVGRYRGKLYFAAIRRMIPGEFVTPEDLQPVVGQKHDGTLCSPLYITTTDYTEEAKSYAELVGISTVDGDKLSRLFDATGLLTELMEEKDRQVIEMEGDRWLPSANELMAYMEEGQQLFAQRRYRDAMRMFQKAAELKPSYDAAWRMVGACYHQLGDYQSAMDFYKMALSHDETDETYYLMGVTMYELGRYEDEISYYRKALSLNPKNVKALNNMGTTLYTLHRYEDALACYDKIIEIDGTDEKVWNNHGVTLKKLGRTEEASESFGRAVGINPDYTDAWINKAALHHELGQFREAAECWHIVTQIIKDNPVLWFRKGEALFNIGQYSLTIEACDSALALQADFREAIELREKAIEMRENEGDSELSPPLGSLYSPQKRDAGIKPLARGELGPSPEELEEKEMETEETAPEPVPEPAEEVEPVEIPEPEEPESEGKELELPPEPEETEQTDVPEPEKTAEPEISEIAGEKTAAPQAAPVEAGDFMTRHTLEERTNILLRLGRTNEAIDLMRKLLDVERTPEYENRLSLLLFENGDLSSAKEHLRRALEMDPEYYPAIYNLAYLEGMEGNYEDEEKLLSTVPERDFRLDLRLSLALMKGGHAEEGAAVMSDIAGRIESEYLWNRVGVALTGIDFEKSGRAFEKALVINPHFYQAWNNRATLLYLEGDMKSAMKYVNRALKIRPDYGPAWTTRGLILMKDSKVDDAVESFREAHLLLGTPQSAGNLAYAQLTAGDARGALKTCLPVFEENIEAIDEGLWNLLGLILMNLGQIEYAETCFRKANSISEEFEDAVKNLGNLSLMEGAEKQRLGRNSGRVRSIIQRAFEEEETGETEAEARSEEPSEVGQKDEVEEKSTEELSAEQGDADVEGAQTEEEAEIMEQPEPEIEAEDIDSLDSPGEEGVADIEDDEFEFPDEAADDYAPLDEADTAFPQDDVADTAESDLPPVEEGGLCPRCGAENSLVDGVCVLCGYVEGDEEGPVEDISEEISEDREEAVELKGIASDLSDVVEYARSLEDDLLHDIEDSEGAAPKEEVGEQSEPEDSEPEKEAAGEDEKFDVKAKQKEVEKQLSSRPKSELIKMCKKRKIPIAGTKKDLLLRLSPVIAEEWKDMMEFLTAIPGVSARKAETIIHVGFSEPGQLKKASVEELSAIKGIGTATAKKIKEAARKL